MPQPKPYPKPADTLDDLLDKLEEEAGELQLVPSEPIGKKVRERIKRIRRRIKNGDYKGVEQMPTKPHPFTLRKQTGF